MSVEWDIPPPTPEQSFSEQTELYERMRAKVRQLRGYYEDAMRYRRLRELIEYGDFLLTDSTDEENAKEVEYANDLDAAIDAPTPVRRGDVLIKLRAERRALEQPLSPFGRSA